MQWIDYETEKPKENDFYYVKGKGLRKAVMYYDTLDGWEIGNLAHNHFSDSNIFWLKED